jgi:protein O-GlcNAc transferase
VPPFELAFHLYQAEELEEAEYLCKQILEMNPDNPDALHLLGSNAYQSGKYEAAIKLIHKAIQNDPTKDHFYSTLGIALFAINL